MTHAGADRLGRLGQGVRESKNTPPKRHQVGNLTDSFMRPGSLRRSIHTSTLPSTRTRSWTCSEAFVNSKMLEMVNARDSERRISTSINAIDSSFVRLALFKSPADLTRRPSNSRRTRSEIQPLRSE
ncbi:uncharacterized protein LOC128092871 [Culex pipiens pallens]|uniref:uncharacterized protein LOC128092871 n=1 Tax=Culex pipiens pallens TaxID=42434 RepID=UPI0022AB0B4F|nr:uncharacterized protein LOC128092871 [Culex pipiens pallens]